jgi:protein-S-isoprenylcysteine O-methyltransferase Ste14
MSAFALRFNAGLLNAWLLCLPIVLVGILVMARRRDVARRMADMTGYTARERLVTIAASLTPYPFMALTVWTPLSSQPVLLGAGLALYAVGLVAYLAAVLTFMSGAGKKLFDTGIYRLSRNPMYVSAALMFVGIGLATGSLVLLGLEAISLVLQHFMILAEERWCRARFGESYQEYAKKVPRYFALIGRGSDPEAS